MRDVLVPEVLLDRPRILALAGELETAGMPQHVRVDGEGEFGELAGVIGPSRSVTNTYGDSG